jgi:tetratricopeptide (TPR) repeat protein
MPAARSYQVRILALGCGAFWVREMTFSSLLENRLVMALYWVLLGLLAVISAPLRGMGRKQRTSSRIVLSALAAAAVLIIGAEESWKSADRAAVAAVTALQEGDTDGTMAAANKAVSIRPVPAYLGLRALIRAHDSMPAWDPQHPFQTILDPAARSRLQDAVRDLDMALAGNPDDDLFWNNRAWIRLELGAAPDDVMRGIRSAVAIDGGSACYRVGLGLLLEQQGRTGEASDQYAAALAASPDSCDSEFASNLKSRSALLWETALSKAIGILQVRDPNDLDVSTRARLARLYLEQGQTARAGMMLDTITKAMPQFPRAWANRGRIYLDSGDLAQAELCLKKAAFLDGSDPTVPTLLARIAKANGDQETADYLQERALMIAGQQASPHAKRLNRMYKTNAIVPDDVLPPGLLAYCTPASKQNLAPQESSPARSPRL